MSKNSKNARLHKEAKDRKRAVNGRAGAESKGPNGPAQTQPKHGKVDRTKYNRADRKGRDMNATGRKGRQDANTAAE